MRLVHCVTFGVAAILGATSSLQAQSSFSIAAGASVPVGSTADAVNVGYNVTAGIGVQPPLAPLGLRIEGMFNQMGYKNFSSANMRIMAATANLTLSGAGVPLPVGYAIGGIGLYNSSSSGFALNPPSDNRIGFNIGAGINFPLTGFSTFLEVRLHYVPIPNASAKFVPITFGLKF